MNNLLYLLELCVKSFRFADAPAQPSWSRKYEVKFTFISLLTAFAINVQAQDIDVSQARSVIENRCVICHGCYDAPCQLKFTAYEGLLRGASKEVVYDQSRLSNAQPTRLFVDAVNESDWRELGFYSVVNPVQPQDNSILEQMLDLKQKFTVASGEPLPADFPLDISRELNCPAPDEMEIFLEEHTEFGMPYGMARLPPTELDLLKRWIATGTPNYQATEPLSDLALELVSSWESFLNGRSDKQRLIARYLYEHLFLGNLTFDNHQSENYFRLIRSFTPPGEAAVEIATPHPNNDPGTEQFYYRIIPTLEVSLDKTHFSYTMDADRLRKIQSLFSSESWSVSSLPGYSDTETSNPFLVFREIPAKIRYEFLLEDAFYFISNFIKGPVCRGQVALNVIPDHFFVAFLAPDYDLSVIDPDYLGSAIENLGLPSREVTPGEHLQVWLERLQSHGDYLEYRDSAYGSHPLTRGGFPLQAIWQGGGEEDTNLLTVFRHYDSATVLPGLVGATPKYAWVIDFPTFERIYYDLVVNYDVFGNVSHQVLTRLYMDYLRMESEGLFLSFLPEAARQPLLEEWYRDIEAQIKVFWAHSDLLFEIPSLIDYKTESYIQELFSSLAPSQNAAGNRTRPEPEMLLAHRQLQTLNANIASSHEWVKWIPDLSYILLYNDDNELHYTASLIRNKAHSNISFIFFEDERRLPSEDTTTFTFGTVGSYPNFFFKIKLAEVEQFVIDLRSVVNAETMTSLVDRYGVRRTDNVIWETLDDLHSWRFQQSGRRDLLDMNRYSNL